VAIGDPFPGPKTGTKWMIFAGAPSLYKYANAIVKELLKLVNICQSYHKNKRVSFFMRHSVYIVCMGTVIFRSRCRNWRCCGDSLYCVYRRESGSSGAWAPLGRPAPLSTISVSTMQGSSTLRVNQVRFHPTRHVKLRVPYSTTTCRPTGWAKNVSLYVATDNFIKYWPIF